MIWDGPKKSGWPKKTGMACTGNERNIQPKKKLLRLPVKRVKWHGRACFAHLRPCRQQKSKREKDRQHVPLYFFFRLDTERAVPHPRPSSARSIHAPHPHASRIAHHAMTDASSSGAATNEQTPAPTGGAVPLPGGAVPLPGALELPLPDVAVICLASAWARRGAHTMAYLERELPLDQVGAIMRFNAVVPADFDVSEVASAAQVAIIRGRAPRLSHADMSKPQQVGCYMSHKALWQVCADSGRPLIVVEDDVRPSRLADRVTSARLRHSMYAADAALVVLMQCCGLASAVHVGPCTPVQQFVGAGMYYVTPAAARLLLRHSCVATMHVDWYMSTCIRAYDLPVFAVPGAGDQFSLDSTLAHSALWDIVTERQKCMVIVASVLACVFLMWAVAVTVYAGVRGKMRR